MQFKASRLMQRPLHDSRNQPVPPWDAQEEFHQGVLVGTVKRGFMSAVKVTTYVCNTQSPPNALDQIVASKVGVLAKSHVRLVAPDPSPNPH